ncbi:MAG: EamA family transporter [Gammaproteobacteria bacterium]|nr:EamA family transporter [Gammaproteobacteria bacterium]
MGDSLSESSGNAEKEETSELDHPLSSVAPVNLRFKIVMAFVTLYLVWGSTYLAIRVGVHDLPPALFAGVRFVISGLALGLYAHLRGEALPRSLAAWKVTVIMGIFLLTGGNGLVVWGEQWVPSNQAALIVATTALWLAGLGTLGSQGQSLTRVTLLGLVGGFAGVALLMFPNSEKFSFDHLGGQIGILLAAFLWSSGSIYGKRHPSGTPPMMSAALQMLTGGVVLVAIGVTTGEVTHWQWSLEGVGALSYLIVFGTLGFVAFTWLLHTVTPSQLGTYAYVNPAVAVVLGWWLLGETLTSTQILGMTIILVGVILVTASSSRR